MNAKKFGLFLAALRKLLRSEKLDQQELSPEDVKDDFTCCHFDMRIIWMRRDRRAQSV